jgi:hypothetical protein
MRQRNGGGSGGRVTLQKDPTLEMLLAGAKPSDVSEDQQHLSDSSSSEPTSADSDSDAEEKEFPLKLCWNEQTRSASWLAVFQSHEHILTKCKAAALHVNRVLAYAARAVHEASAAPAAAPAAADSKRDPSDSITPPSPAASASGVPWSPDLVCAWAVLRGGASEAASFSATEMDVDVYATRPGLAAVLEQLATCINHCSAALVCVAGDVHRVVTGTGDYRFPRGAGSSSLSSRMFALVKALLKLQATHVAQCVKLLSQLLRFAKIKGGEGLSWLAGFQAADPATQMGDSHTNAGGALLAVEHVARKELPLPLWVMLKQCETFFPGFVVPFCAFLYNNQTKLLSKIPQSRYEVEACKTRLLKEMSRFAHKLRSASEGAGEGAGAALRVAVVEFADATAASMAQDVGALFEGKKGRKLRGGGEAKANGATNGTRKRTSSQRDGGADADGYAGPVLLNVRKFRGNARRLRSRNAAIDKMLGAGEGEGQGDTYADLADFIE